MTARSGLLGIALLFVSIFAASSEIDPVPGVSKSQWTVGLAVLDHDQSDTSLSTAATLFPRLILAGISDAEIHEMAEGEVRQLAEDFLEEKITDSYKNLVKLHEERDKWFFELSADPARVQESDEKLMAEQETLQQWRELPWEAVEVPSSMPISFPAGSGDEEIRLLGTQLPDIYREDEDLDLLLTGSVVRVGKYFGVRIQAFTSDGMHVLWEGAGEEGDFYEMAQEATRAARTLVLGREWSGLTVQTDPGNALISVNGRDVGIGYWSDSRFRPGEIVVEVSAHDYEPRIERLVLKAGESRELNLALEGTGGSYIIVRSDPLGADVRLGTQWLGQTPLLVAIPDRVMPLSFELSGFQSRTVPLAPDTGRLTVPLEVAIDDPKEAFLISQKKLYNATALFAFSLAPTIILSGINSGYEYLADYKTSSQYPDNYRTYQITTGLMWGSVAVNIGLLSFVLVRLSKYLKAAEDLSD